MEGKSTSVALYKETPVKLGESTHEHVIVGVDPVSFIPFVRIYDKSTRAYVSFAAKHFRSFSKYLRETLEDHTWSKDRVPEGLRITIEVLHSPRCEAYRFRGEQSEVTMSAAEVYELAYGKEMDLLYITNSFLFDYKRIKADLLQIQMSVYEKYSADTFERITKYFDDKNVQKCRNFSRLVNYFGIWNLKFDN